MMAAASFWREGWVVRGLLAPTLLLSFSPETIAGGQNFAAARARDGKHMIWRLLPSYGLRAEADIVSRLASVMIGQRLARLRVARTHRPVDEYIICLHPSPFWTFFFFLFFILTLFGWLRSRRRSTTDWSLHCTARRNNPFNGLRVIDRRILWHFSFGITIFLFIIASPCAGLWRRDAFPLRLARFP
ncbi:uncharacterized protein BO66DRAFT_191476 [Aspergillus aculeatinus CBS 121060]|uniref:Uncharacterized protein n=1 Tax=Aspergillus aculeatinus CBS 121060 TaxID=1448322 RepID=A0ACD1GXG1_9EURO|nr:hypothetical protein BO66DRAFT_191476 [Aspergillus aculeatinus CBS 121060]RAH65953.1 hypothetical protein BO66DRAFT_191476 [Aspergillus aculeatinus CBS 121060]